MDIEKALEIILVKNGKCVTYVPMFFILSTMAAAAAAAKSLQSCPTLCNPLDYSPPHSSVHGISRQEPWIGLPFPSPGYLPNSGIEPRSLASPSLAGGFFTTEPLRKPQTQDFIHTQILRYRVYMYTLVYIISSLREARSSNSSEIMSRPSAQILVS